MPPLIPCEFFLIRYVPDVVKGEFTNIGVLLREAGPGGGSSPQLRFTRDWSRVRCVDPDADVALLEALEAELSARLLSEAAASPATPLLSLATPLLSLAKPLLSLLSDSLSNSIQISEPRACLAESLQLELAQLMRLHVDPPRVKTQRSRTGRAAIAAAMRSEFERTGTWAVMRKRIAASLYTRPGDPMKLDCGYLGNLDASARASDVVVAQAAPSGLVRIFHAVSLAGDVEAAKGLAYSAPQLREGVLRVEGAGLELTAVVEPIRSVSSPDSGRLDSEGPDSEDGAGFSDEAAERYRFGVDALERQQIRVITLNDLARAAETARLELRL